MPRLAAFFKKHYPWFVLALAVFLGITFASQCSFLYRINEWEDVHCYYTVASVMRSGGVLYRDIFEQKGPYLYFIHVAAIAIAPGKYWGMYLFELVYAGIFVYATYRTLSLFIQNKLFVTLGSAAVLLLYLISYAFMRGDSVEEMMIPFFALCLYWLIAFAQGKKEITWWRFILSGAFAGLALFSKFPLVAFFAGFGIAVFVLYAKKHEVDKGFLAAAFFLAGLFLSAIPALIYFGVNHAYEELFRVYFYDNIFHYSSAKTMTFLDRLFGFFVSWGVRFGFGYSYFIAILFGFFYIVFCKRIPKDRVFFSVLGVYIAVNAAIVFGGVSYPYYGLPNAAFSFIGVIALYDLLTHKQKAHASIKAHERPVVGTAFAALCALSFLATPNMPRMFVPEQDIMQYQMKEIIDKEDNPTLLNYGTLDIGLYYLCDIKPYSPYFTGLNGEFKEVDDDQNRIVDEGLVTFVVAHSDKLPEHIDDHYLLVYSRNVMDMGRHVTYYLYQRKA